MPEETKEFEIGDVVILKSGGPHMTVDKVVDDKPKIIHCVWFGLCEQGVCNVLTRDTFASTSLTLLPAIR